jgi:CHAD domain-containing protein
MKSPANRPGLLTKELDVFEAVRRVLFVQFRTITLNAEQVLHAEDENPLHDIRIAIRRARTVLRGFHQALERTSAGQLERNLQRLNRALGQARDLDVWIAFLKSGAVQPRLARNRNWDKFVGHQETHRLLQQATVRRHLSSSQSMALQTKFGRLLRIELPRASQHSLRTPIGEVAKRVLEKHLRKALKMAKLRHSESPEKLHRLRIELRRARYLCGFIGQMLGPEIDKLYKRAHAAERVLGDIRDASLALARIQVEGPSPPRLLVLQLRQSHRNAVAQLEGVWRRFEDPELLSQVHRVLTE